MEKGSPEREKKGSERHKEEQLLRSCENRFGQTDRGRDRYKETEMMDSDRDIDTHKKVDRKRWRQTTIGNIRKRQAERQTHGERRGGSKRREGHKAWGKGQHRV